MSSHEQEHHVVPYRVYIVVWAALLMLTGVTVGVSRLDLQQAAIIAALIIACGKALLVTLYFMHVRFDRPLIAVMIAAALGTYLLFIGLTFADYWYR